MTNEARSNSRIIETKTASLDTLSVTIRALHVSGKQMTLAVFRQLPVAELCDEFGEPFGNWWGRVIYPLKNEADHWMIVEYEGQLHRCAIYDANFYNSEAGVKQLIREFKQAFTRQQSVVSDAMTLPKMQCDYLGSIDGEARSEWKSRFEEERSSKFQEEKSKLSRMLKDIRDQEEFLLIVIERSKSVAAAKEYPQLFIAV